MRMIYHVKLWLHNWWKDRILQGHSITVAGYPESEAQCWVGKLTTLSSLILVYILHIYYIYIYIIYLFNQPQMILQMHGCLFIPPLSFILMTFSVWTYASHRLARSAALGAADRNLDQCLLARCALSLSGRKPTHKGGGHYATTNMRML